MVINVSKLYWVSLFFMSFILFLGSNQLIPVSAFNKKTLLVFFLIFLVKHLKRSISILSRSLNNWPIWVVVGWCFLSTIWSTSPTISFYESITQLLLILFCIALAETFSATQILEAFRKAFLLIACLNVLYIFVFFGESITSIGLRGLFNQKNHLGLFAALGATLWLFHLLKTKRKRHVGVFALFLTLLILSNSKTSLFLFITCGFVTIFLSRSLGNLSNRKVSFDSTSKLLIKLFWFVLILSASAGVLLNLSWLVDTFTNSLTDELFTGRGQLWKVMLYAAKDDLFFGLGYSAVWFGNESSLIYSTDLFEHNPIWVETLAASDGGYIDVLLSLGAIGLIFVVVLLVRTFSHLYNLMQKHAWAREFFAIFMFISLHNITESTLLLFINPFWLLIILISLIASREIRISRRH